MADKSILGKVAEFFNPRTIEKPLESKPPSMPLVEWGLTAKELHPYYGVVSGVYYAQTGMPWLSADARKAVKTEWFWQPIRGQPRRVDTNELRKYSNTIWVQSIVQTILNQIAMIPLEVVPKDDFEFEEVEEERKLVEEFLAHPNKNDEQFSDILRAWLKDVLEIDAGVLVKVYTIESYDFEHLEPRSGAPLLKPLICPECGGYGTGSMKGFKQKAEKCLKAIEKMEKELPEKVEFNKEDFHVIKPDYSEIKQKLMQVVSANSPNDINGFNNIGFSGNETPIRPSTEMAGDSVGCPYCNGTGRGRQLTEIYCHDGAAFLKDSDRTGWTYGYWQYCMTKNNLIETKSGVKKIIDVKEGDYVLSDNGKWNKVLDNYERYYEGEFVKIKGQGMPEIECTAEHPFLVKRNDKEEWIEAKALQTTDFLIAVSEQEQEDFEIELYSSDSYEAIQKQNYEKVMLLSQETGKRSRILSKELNLSRPTIQAWLKGKSKPKCCCIPWKVKLDEELSELLGWFVAEGCITRGNIVNFTLAYTEGEQAERIQYLMKKYFNLNCSFLRQDNVIQLRFFNKVLAQWFLKNFYVGEKHNALTKTIPSFIMKSKKELQKHFLGAVIEGDGYVNPAGSGITTASNTLAFDIRRMIIRLGAYPTMSYNKPKKHEYKGRIISSSGSWNILMNVNAMKNIVLNANEVQNGNQKTIQLQFGRFYVPILKIEKENKIEKVYNIHVANTNNYTANGFVNHNSYSIPAHPMWFNRDEIIYFMETPRSQSVYGWSAVQSSLEAVKSLEYSLRHNMSLFLDGAVPDGVVSVEDMSNEELIRMKSMWENELKGQPHKVVFMNKKTTFQPFAFKNRDMQFIEGQKATWSQVIANFGLAPADLGITDKVNKGTAGNQTEMSRRKTIRPKIKKIENLLNSQLLPELGVTKVVLKFINNDPVEERMRAELDELYLRARVKSINEIRMEMGLVPVEWGDGMSMDMTLGGQGNPFSGDNSYGNTHDYSKPSEVDAADDERREVTRKPNKSEDKEKDYQYPFQSQVPFVTAIQNLSTPVPFALPKQGHPNTMEPYKDLAGLCPGCGCQQIYPIQPQAGSIAGVLWHCQRCDRTYSEEEFQQNVGVQQEMHERDKLAPKLRGDYMAPNAPIPNLVPSASIKSKKTKVWKGIRYA